jgi:hypothetical protein
MMNKVITPARLDHSRK